MTDRGLVYYVLDATRLELRVKIGWTTNLGARLDALRSQTASRQPPILLALEAGEESLERDRHQEFKRLWLRGEWFRYEEELREHIGSLPNPYGFVSDRPDLWYFARGWQGFTGWAMSQGEDRSIVDDSAIRF